MCNFPVSEIIGKNIQDLFIRPTLSTSEGLFCIRKKQVSPPPEPKKLKSGR